METCVEKLIGREDEGNRSQKLAKYQRRFSLKMFENGT